MKNLMEACKGAITFFMAEDVWDYSRTVLIKGFLLPSGSPFLQTPSVKSLWLYLADA